MEESTSLSVTTSNDAQLEIVSVTAGEIIAAHKQVVDCTWRLMETGNDFVHKAAACGKLLLAKKSEVGHGNFLPWLAENVKEFSYRTAADYMKAARYLEEDPNLQGVANSMQAIRDLRKAVAMLDDKPESDPQTREKPAFVIRCVFNIEPEQLDEVQRRTAFDQAKPLLQAFEHFGYIEIKS